MVRQFKVSEFGNFGLKLLNGLILEFFHLAAMDADQMVVVISSIELKDRVATFKVMPHHKASGFKLGEDAVDRGEPYFFAFIDQRLEDVFGAEMLSVARALQDLEDLDAGQGDFKPCVPDIFAFQRELLPGVKVAFIGYDGKSIKANSSYHAAIFLCWSGCSGRNAADRL